MVWGGGGEPKPFTHFLGFSDFSFCLVSFFMAVWNSWFDGGK